jgi:hypothetical protein
LHFYAKIQFDSRGSGSGIFQGIFLAGARIEQEKHQSA